MKFSLDGGVDDDGRPEAYRGLFQFTLRSFLAFRRHSFSRKLTLALLAFVACLWYTLSILSEEPATNSVFDEVAKQRYTVTYPHLWDNNSFKDIDESVMPPIVIRSTDQVCAMCTDGLVYVHLGRHATAEERWSNRPRAFTVAEELYVEPSTAPVFTAASGSADEVVSRCLAQLASLGQMGMAVNGKPQLTASVIVDFDSATPQTSLGVGGQCPGFLADVRPVAKFSAVKMDVSYPRLPSWPLPYALNPTLHGGTDAHGTLPLYFGTVAVRETHVDKDVRPPLSVALTEDRGAVVIRFGEDETSTRPEPFEMRCPAHFMSVMVGRFGRYHDQVQEMMHTLALTPRTNRTFIVPVLVPDIRVPFLRIDAQKAYGFNALRREGGYCLVTYEEARRVLKELEANGESMTLQRFNYHGGDRPKSFQTDREADKMDWGVCANFDEATQARWFDMDAWLEDSLVRSPPAISVGERRDGGMVMKELTEPMGAAEVFPEADEEKYVRMARMRKAAKMMMELLGGDHAKTPDGAPQPRLAVMSARMAFYLRPPMVEQTRLMGLLRPAAAITAEVDRWYSRTAAALRWPTAGSVTAVQEGTRLELRDTLRTGNFKKVMGFHIRRRESSCRDVALKIGEAAPAIDTRFQLEHTDPGWSSPLSTLRGMELDCALTKGRIVELYKQYARWMRENTTMTAAAAAATTNGMNAAASAATSGVPTIYMALGERGEPIDVRVEKRLRRLREGSRRTEVWGGSTKAEDFPEAFVSSFDRRPERDLRAVVNDEEHKWNAVMAHPDQTEGELRRLRAAYVVSLYPQGLQALSAVATDYFILTNVATFRGVTVSSGTTNVMMRRWGRGLPCHSVLFGYVQAYYAPTWV